MAERVWGVVVAGLGGQGVIKTSDILAQAAFDGGWDVKKAEIHGMSQRGGSVSSDVRFGPRVLSPMIPAGEADCLLLVDVGQLAANADRPRPDAPIITPELIDPSALTTRRALGVALLGVLSHLLPLEVECWQQAIRDNLAERLWSANLAAFDVGRSVDVRSLGATT